MFLLNPFAPVLRRQAALRDTCPLLRICLISQKPIDFLKRKGSMAKRPSVIAMNGSLSPEPLDSPLSRQDSSLRVNFINNVYKAAETAPGLKPMLKAYDRRASMMIDIESSGKESSNGSLSPSASPTAATQPLRRRGYSFIEGSPDSPMASFRNRSKQRLSRSRSERRNGRSPEREDGAEKAEEENFEEYEFDLAEDHFSGEKSVEPTGACPCLACPCRSLICPVHALLMRDRNGFSPISRLF